ncbi:MAG: ATP-binding protein [Candidatus Promineifilaceae bacterium]
MNQTFLKQQQVERLREFALIFVGLLVTVWVTVQRPLAPQLMLLILLYVITINFSIAVEIGYVGLTAIVAITSILTVGVTDALIAGVAGVVLAELMRPFWRPLWRSITVRLPNLRDRLVLGVFTIVSLALAAQVVQPTLQEDATVVLWLNRVNLPPELFQITPLLAVYFVATILMQALYWRWSGAAVTDYFSQAGSYLLGNLFFTVPLSLFLISAEISIPAFVLLCIGIATFSVIAFNAWQRRYQMVQRLVQFAQLNEIGQSLRETLDLNTVLARTHTQAAQLVPADNFFIALSNADGSWDYPTVVSPNEVQLDRRVAPDDLTGWTVSNNRLLELDPQTIHYAQQRNLTLPDPMPLVWLSIPLTTAQRTIGALVLQKFADGDPFTLWNREVLLAFAGQASAAIENARLYNLTDEALARRVEQLQALLFSITEGVLMLDREGQIVLVNPEAAKLLKNSAEQLQNSAIDPTLGSQMGFEAAELSDLLTQLNSSDIPTPRRHDYQLDNRYYQRDEVPVTSDSNQLMGWLMVFRDVTEERERAEWRADLTRMIVHDLRNPITTLSSTMTLIENRLPDAHRVTVTDLLATARHGTANMLEMVDSLMDINRAEVGKFVVDAEAMRIEYLSAEIMAQLEPLAVQRGINLRVSAENDLPAVWGDEEILRRVLVNLLDNAMKFTPSGGRVQLSLTSLPPTSTHEAGVVAQIEDDGPGIPADQKTRIFDRFITFNRGGGQIRGTGLGLTFCKLAIEAHEGHIWVDDGVDGGSVFTFTVPGIPEFDQS